MSLARFSKFERLLDRVVPAMIVGLGLWVTAAVAAVSI
jgi:hypothetical protein